MTPEQETVWADVGFVKASQYRVAVVTHLGIGPATPSALADTTDYVIADISRALARLREHEIVEECTPNHEMQGRRCYRLTEHGQEVIEALQERGV